MKPLALGAAAATAVAVFAVGIETSKPSSDDTIGTEMADSSNSQALQFQVRRLKPVKMPRLTAGCGG